MPDDDLILKFDSAEARILRIVLIFFLPIWALGLPLRLIDSLSHSNGHFAANLLINILLIASLLIVANNRVRMNARGLKLPLYLTFFANCGRNLAWRDITAIEVDNPGVLPTLKLNMRGGKSCKLYWNRFDRESRRKFLLALKLWLPDSVDREGLEKLAVDGDKKLLATSSNSFTSIWESSFATGFGTTAFVPLEAGKTLGQGALTVVKALSFSGLSAVYLCKDSEGFKILKESVVPFSAGERLKQKASELFKREAALLLKVEHPQLARVCDFFEEDERTYMLLSYEDGLSLRQKVRQEGPTTTRETAEIALSLLEPLRYLHASTPSIIHRDVSPDNVILRADKTAVLIDFGAAAEFLGTVTGTMIGKQCYMAPEQFKGKARKESDIYGLGATMYYLLTGLDPTPMSSLKPVCSDDALATLVQEMTALDWSERLTDLNVIEARLKLCE